MMRCHYISFRVPAVHITCHIVHIAPSTKTSTGNSPFKKKTTFEYPLILGACCFLASPIRVPACSFTNAALKCQSINQSINQSLCLNPVCAWLIQDIIFFIDQHYLHIYHIHLCIPIHFDILVSETGRPQIY